MPRTYLTIASIILAITILFALFFQGTNLKTNLSKKTPSITPSPNQNIILNSPRDNEIIGTSFDITGQARVFENTFSFRLKNLKNNKTYAESSTITDAKDADQFGNFSFLLNFGGNSPDIKDGDNLLLEIFQHSPKDGTEIDKTSVVLKFKDNEKQTIKLFFPNSRLTKAFLCSQVYPVETTIDKTAEPAKAALIQLLKGPDDKNLSQGYSSNLINGLTIQNFSIQSNTAHLNFDKNISQNDKCKTQSALNQISQTLKQFPEIKSTHITINNQLIAP